MNMDSVNEDNLEQAPTSQVVGVSNMNKVHGDVGVTENQEDRNVVNAVNVVNVVDEVLSSQVLEMGIVAECHG